MTDDEEDEEEDEEGPQGEEGPQPRGGARESLPPRASAAAADHQSYYPAALLRRSTRVLPIATYNVRASAAGATKGHHPWRTGTRQDKDDDMGQDGYERLQASTEGGSAREYQGTT